MYFIKMTQTGGKTNLKPLGGQVLKRTSQPLRVDYTVRTDSPVVKNYGVGIKYVVQDLREGAGYYEAVGDVRVMVKGVPAEATPAEWKVYGEYMRRQGSEKDVPAKEPEEPEEDTYFSKLKRNKQFAKPTIEDDGFYVTDDVWYLLVRNINNQKNSMLLGNTGCGKTSMIILAYRKLGVPLSVFDMSVMQDPIAGLQGVHRLKGDSRFEYSRHVQALKKSGGVLYDEMSRAPQLASNILFPVLDDRRTLYVDVAGEDDERIVAVHRDCSITATANIGAAFTGTFQMDRALTRRFQMIEIDYPPMDMEIKIYMKRTGDKIKEAQARHVVKILTDTRTKYAKGELSDAASVGEGIEVCELIRDGMPVNKALELVLFPLYPGTKDDGERKIVNIMITSR